jgi:MoaA/NifB/PqqE/SkfB family radical SAM enzyme
VPSINNCVTLNLSIARSCFVQCGGCYNHFSKNPCLVSDEVVLDFLTWAFCRGVKKATICGGDPLSRPNIIELLGAIKQLGFFVTVDTFGAPLLRDETTIFHGRHLVKQISAQELSKYADLIGIPLDGPSDAIISSFRKGRDNVFNDQLAILGLLDQYNASICINSVICKTNYSSMVDLIPFVKKLKNIKLWQFFQFMPIGPLGFKNREKYWIEDSVFRAFQHEMLQAAAKDGFSAALDFKSALKRKGGYILIDSNGDAWTPDYHHFKSECSQMLTPTRERIIIGNIKNKEDWDSILDAVRSCQATSKKCTKPSYRP